ncbi:MAG: ADP-glyceromanno-heptose 6-epimerase [Alphaproteobacteria bacterium]
MILVTGGAGFIGSNIVAALCEAGEDVVVSDWLGRDDKWRNLAKHDIVDIIPPDRLADWLPAGPEAVVHMGAISSTTETDGDALYENNVATSMRLWRWCADTRTPLIYASSAATYGDGAAGFDDAGDRQSLMRLKPLNGYGWSKLTFDRQVAREVAAGTAPPTWAGLRFFNVYGPNEYHKDDMRSVVCKNHPVARDGEAVKLFRSHRPDYADGEQLRDFIYVRDCVAVVTWLLQGKASGLFNVGTGQARSFLDLVKALYASLDQQPLVEFIDMPEAIRERYQYFTEARIDRLRAAGYDAPFTSLEDGVADYVHSYLSSDDPYR